MVAVAEVVVYPTIAGRNGYLHTTYFLYVLTFLCYISDVLQHSADVLCYISDVLCYAQS